MTVSQALKVQVVLVDRQGKNLGANQENLQQQALGEEAKANMMNQVLGWIGFNVVANRQALCSEILAEIQDMTDRT